MKRLYYGELLRRIRFLDGSLGHEDNPNPDVWYVHLDACDPHVRSINTFQSAALKGLIADIKAAGYPIWGQDILDYVYPYSAWDKLVMDELLQLRKRVKELESEGA